MKLDEALCRALKSRPRLVVLSGAGMSAESGVPIFRGAGGLWEGFRPEDLATPEAFATNPQRVWRWYQWRGQKVSEAQPHKGHQWLARLESEAHLPSFHVVTQNVDRMHQRAGNNGVIELHGNIMTARCTLHCGFTMPSADVPKEDFSCPCGKGMLRPEVVWFGEGLPEEAFSKAGQVLDEASMVWVLGTSSVVYPAAALPGMAAQRGIPVVEINPEETPLSSQVPYSFRCLASEGIEALCQQIMGKENSL
ncbi:MAG: NAD-dependent deacylase [Candidatus Eisenbacteria bacterium]|uniref:NAD-dependent protein deacylase n=1 Tax=Eiseniibacteriota bacterium TaxID=2212470 RepID=A0A7Y2EA42_UNCEI|nr:NAD-dependent deacylase [Candidatus Eisenbacteria bacterium]